MVLKGHHGIIIPMRVTVTMKELDCIFSLVEPPATKPVQDKICLPCRLEKAFTTFLLHFAFLSLLDFTNN